MRRRYSIGLERDIEEVPENIQYDRHANAPAFIREEGQNNEDGNFENVDFPMLEPADVHDIVPDEFVENDVQMRGNEIDDIGDLEQLNDMDLADIAIDFDLNDEVLPFYGEPMDAMHANGSGDENWDEWENNENNLNANNVHVDRALNKNT